MISAKENAGLARHLFADALRAYAIEPGLLSSTRIAGQPMIARSDRDFLDVLRRAPQRLAPVACCNGCPFSGSSVTPLTAPARIPGPVP
ncbi:MAG: hypothetical protein U5K43_13745 [Halofilum sp. (in: g-proteobacteria)]|nr:hypothetical protein [Halofilum sp. (in: g-proteobacteria)]